MLPNAMEFRLPRRSWFRVALVAVPLVVAGVLVWWRGPDWGAAAHAFAAVAWHWVVVAVLLNLLSVLVRSLAWQVVVRQAMTPPRPGFVALFSAFCVGLLGNVVLPGRVGELARVAVLTRRLPGRSGAWATLVGTVFAHRVFDLFPVIALITYVLIAAKIPHWAITSLALVVAVGLLLFGIAFVAGRRQHRQVLDEVGAVRRLVALARRGLGVMREPFAAARAVFFQGLGWLCQLFAVFTAMRAFHIHEGVAAAGLVLVLMNLATIFPLWPGNVGLVQAAIALPLVPYGVAYAHGFAFGIGLQAIEASVGVSVGLIFLAREGLSFATLRRMPSAAEEVVEEADEPEEPEPARARARVPG